VKDGRAAIENNGFVFVAVEVDDFFAFGNGGERLRREAERFECLSGGVELAEAAIDQNQRRQRLRFLRRARKLAFADANSVVSLEGGSSPAGAMVY